MRRRRCLPMRPWRSLTYSSPQSREGCEFSRQFSRRNKKGLASYRKPLMFLAPEVGLEPTTP
ncbi:hypothetical protein XAP6164_4330017 [Xanthomonas phaseoli pv. phaseoli]|nr:hypothetical protein XAP6164_4330017 [Xanthomonas phaseoli pv. phaseoli]